MKDECSVHLQILPEERVFAMLRPGTDANILVREAA